MGDSFFQKKHISLYISSLRLPLSLIRRRQSDFIAGVKMFITKNFAKKIGLVLFQCSKVEQDKTKNL
jgi:hypothetical protein